MKKLTKIVFGMFLFSAIFLLGNMTVYADDEVCYYTSQREEKVFDCKNHPDYSLYNGTYFQSTVSGEGSNATLSLDINGSTLSSADKNKLKNISFSYNCNGRSGTISAGQSISINSGCVATATGTFPMLNENGDVLRINSNKEEDPNGEVQYCHYSISVGADMWSGSQDPNVTDSTTCTFDDRHEDIQKSKDNKINCNSPKDSFEVEFCKAKLGAASASEDNVYFPEKFGLTSIDYTTLTDKGSFNLLEMHKSKKFIDVATGSDSKAVQDGHNEKMALLKCDPSRVTAEDNVDQDPYYKNVKYMYGSGITEVFFGNYKYHYSGKKNVTTGEAVKCKLFCEEAVTVKFGPPASSKAGACFEYKVKVTSRVNCNIEKEPPKPKTSTEYCTPTPNCISSGTSGSAGGSFNSICTTNTTHCQGGPNEDYDACIKSCDGGKYTPSCSTKCYKDVYGNSSLSKSNSSNSDAQVQKLNTVCNVSQPNLSGYYYKSNGSIMWTGTWSGTEISGSGRWYANKTFGANWGIGSLSRYQSRYPTNGIPRSTNCTDTCWWSGCSGDVYLNPEWPSYDISQNGRLYDLAVDQCTALAKCTTSTAEFTISTDVEDYKGTEQTVNFPYTTLNGRDRDYLSSGGGGADTRSARNTTLIDEINEGYGCYDSDDASRWYHSEWTFPGSYINNKTMEVSYLNHKGDSSWQEKKGFCLPLTAKNVNKDWWLWFNYNKIASKAGTSANDISSSECGAWNATTSSTGSTSSTTKKYNGNVEKWNINAYSEKFGYYEWNIHMECFYALNTIMPGAKSSSDDGKEKCCQDECCGDNCLPQGPYRIRSVDLKQLFPATGGASGERTVGFNWSKYAKNTINNPGYTSVPDKYKEQVESLGYEVYSDQYLDYYFVLSKDALRDIKNSKSNYSEFDGEIKIRDNGITSYYSNSIRSFAQKAPDKGPATTCNNLNAPSGKSGHSGYTCNTLG